MYKDEKRFLIGCAVFMLVVLAGIGITTYMNDVKSQSNQDPSDRIQITDPWGQFPTQSLGSIIDRRVATEVARQTQPTNNQINQLQGELENEIHRLEHEIWDIEDTVITDTKELQDNLMFTHRHHLCKNGRDCKQRTHTHKGLTSPYPEPHIRVVHD